MSDAATLDRPSSTKDGIEVTGQAAGMDRVLTLTNGKVTGDA